MVNKNKGSSFNEYLLENLRDDDQAVFFHIKNALETIKEDNGYQYLIRAINDVATARGKSGLAKNIGLSRQGFHKILTGNNVPSFKNIIAILNELGLQISVEQVQNANVEDEPANVLDVAQYASKSIPRNSTYMKLQKIVYYAQVESLMHFKKLLFKEKILAWCAGPVVRELFDKHRGYRFLRDVSLGDASQLTMEQKSCVDWAVDKYGNLDGDILSHLTHVEDPWKKARKGLPAEKPSEEEITARSIVRYYSNLPKYAELEEQAEHIK